MACYIKKICWLMIWWGYCVGESPKWPWWLLHMMSLNHGSILQGHHFCPLVDSIPRDGSITPIWDAKELEKSIRIHNHQGQFGQLKMLQCFSLKVVPFRNGLVLWLINGLLLISADMSQGVAQNPLVHINMVLLAQTFGSSGWMTKPTRLHKHVMVLCQVLNKEPCGQVYGQKTNHLAYPSWTFLCPWRVWILIYKEVNINKGH
jgi:hypothetical protein